MRKTLGIICGLAIGCNALYGNTVALNKTSYEFTQTEIENDSVYDVRSLKEQILAYFKEEKDRDVFRKYLVNENTVSQGDIAKLLCHYIDRGPIYLPEKEGCNSPFIGRLVIEGIWGQSSYEETALIDLQIWDTLFVRATMYKENKNFLTQILETSSGDVRRKINDYHEILNKPQAFSKVSLGKLNKSSLEISLYEKNYLLYEYLGVNYITIKDLENIGFKKMQMGAQTQLIWQGSLFSDAKQDNLAQKAFYLSFDPVYIGELKTYSLGTDTEILIPVRALQVYFDLSISENKIAITPKNRVMSEYILCSEENIINQTDQTLQIMYTDLYWDGKNIIEHSFGFEEIGSYGKAAKNNKLYKLRNMQYLTTLIQFIETDSMVLESSSRLGQDAAELFKKYNETINQKVAAGDTPKHGDKQEQEKKEMFPASIIMGTMKYSAGGLVKGKKVEVWRAEDGISYWVKDDKSKTIKVPWNSVSIPKNPPTAKDKPAKEQIEAFINSKDINSQTQYLVWTDLYRQQTYIFEGKKNEWKLIKTLVCSTGKNTTPTPRGTFELTNKVAYFGVDKGYRCKYAFQIFGDYLYHSIIFDVTGTRLLEGKGVLGQRASQGCIRFSESDSLWFYNTMKSGTRVWIN